MNGQFYLRYEWQVGGLKSTCDSGCYINCILIGFCKSHWIRNVTCDSTSSLRQSNVAAFYTDYIFSCHGTVVGFGYIECVYNWHCSFKNTYKLSNIVNNSKVAMDVTISFVMY